MRVNREQLGLRNDMIRALTVGAGLTFRDANAALRVLMDYFQDRLLEGGGLRLTGIGTLESKIRAEKTTPSGLLHPKQYRVVFRQSKTLTQLLIKKSRLKWIEEYKEYDKEKGTIRRERQTWYVGYSAKDIGLEGERERPIHKSYKDS